MSVYEKFTFRGKTLDRMTIAALAAAEKRLGYANTIVQGSYNAGGVSASAGTHDGGGAADLVWYDIKRKNRCLRRYAKFAGWPRDTLPGVWGRHWHGILIGNDQAAPLAKTQVISYRNKGTGLASGGTDHWWRPKKITEFNYNRCALVSWKRLNKIAGHKHGKAFTNSGAREVEVVARALEGFGMSLGKHRKGRMDKPLLDAIERFKDIRNVRAHVDAPLNPKTCYELCIPTKESD